MKVSKIKNSKKTLVKVGIATTFLLGALLFASCEDDALVTPINNDNTDDCTGSYCKIEMNKSSETPTVAFVNDKSNPENF